jgi:PAS domain S-box-containing protein
MEPGRNGSTRPTRTPFWIVACAALTVILLVLDLLSGAGGAWMDAVRTVTLAGLGILVLWGVHTHRRRTSADAGRALLQTRLEEAFGLLDVIFERAPVGLAYFDRDLRYVRINDHLAEINGFPVEAHIGATVADLLPGMPGEVSSDLRRVLETGRPLTEVHVSGVTPAQPGSPREFLVSYWPVRQAGHDEITGAGCVVFEVTERRQAQRELRAQTDRYEALLLALSEAGEGMLVLEEDGRCVYANAAFEHISAYPFPELAAMDSVFGIIAPADRAEAQRRTQLGVEQGLIGTEYQLTIVRRDGEPVDLEVVGVPLQVEGRRRIVVVAHDVTDRRRVEVERERMLRRSALMAEASELFDQTLDETATLERVARLCVRELADTCVVVLGTAPGAIRRVAAAAHDPRVERTLLELQLRYPVDEGPVPPIAEALRSGRSQLLDPISDEMIVAGTVDDHHRELIRGLGATSALMVPLRARGAVRGVLALGFATLPGQDRDELVALFEDLGRRAALALDTARLYEERSAVARTLQRSLLPPALPDVPGLELAARYLAAGEDTEVGGDFYDCFPTGPGEWAAVIGDVCGKGAEAAAVTALARHTIRAAVVHDPQPAAVLRELNAAILRHGTDFRFCTVLYVRLVPQRDGVEACIATGGHPLPVLLRASGEAGTAGRPGTLLGVVPEPAISETSIRLRAGDALVLFTDGVTEASPLDDALGPERLAEFLGTCAGKNAGRIAAGIEGKVLELQRGHPRDDVAVLVVRVTPGSAAPFAPSAEGVAARS